MPGSEDCYILVESPEETDVGTMGLSTGDQGKEGAQTDAPHPDGTSEHLSSTKLCGYLHKQGGPLRVWKRRWFIYEEKKCQLFYYRTAQDVNPLGKVELCNATFSYPLQGEEGTFHIQTPERTFILKVGSVSVQFFLSPLQNLYRRRKTLLLYPTHFGPFLLVNFSCNVHTM